MRSESFLVPLLVLGLAVAPAHAQDRGLRIGLLDGVGSFTFSSSTPADIYGADDRVLGTVSPREAWEVRRGTERTVELVDGSRQISAQAPVRVVPRTPAQGVGLVFVGSRWYRGSLEIQPGLVAVDDVPLEQYLYGVVPCEMSPSWPMEALKAQAVAARTYALANLGEHASHGYDLKASTDDQCYGGASMEHPSTDEAVDATRGEVLTYDGRPIDAYYCADAGGYTDGADTVWLTKPIPYLKPVPDFDQAAPSYSWRSTLAEGELIDDLSRHGISVGQPTQIDPLSRGFSGRIKMLKIVGTEGARELSGENFRYYTGLKSALFNVAPMVGPSGQVTGFAFAGRGHGHGVGMSQWGARGLGQMGYNYMQILEHYYPSTELTDREAALP